MENALSKIAIVYGVLWLLSFWIQNLIYTTVVSGFGVVLLIVIAIGVEGAFGDIDKNLAMLESQINTLRKEIDELKNSGTQANNDKDETK